MKKTIMIWIMALVLVLGIGVALVNHGTGNADTVDGMHWDGASATDGIKDYIDARAGGSEDADGDGLTAAIDTDDNSAWNKGACDPVEQFKYCNGGTEILRTSVDLGTKADCEAVCGYVPGINCALYNQGALGAVCTCYKGAVLTATTADYSYASECQD
jgi:hypothetical protein